MPYDIGEFNPSGEWRSFDRPSTSNPWPIGSRVTVDGSAGTVTAHAALDDLSFRVTFDDGAWGKYASWQLESAR